MVKNKTSVVLVTVLQEGANRGLTMLFGGGLQSRCGCSTGSRMKTSHWNTLGFVFCFAFSSKDLDRRAHNIYPQNSSLFDKSEHGTLVCMNQRVVMQN